MSRYTGGKTKLSRRVNRNLFLKGARSYSAKDDYNKRPFLRKKTKRRSRISEYGKQLTEKQILRYTYGLNERQLSNLFKKSFKKKGDTGQLVLNFLEKRLDNVVYRAGLANSRSQARQLVNHGHFEVNGVKTNIPSFLTKSGDIISVRKTKLKSNFWKEFNLEIPNQIPSWLEVSDKTIKAINDPLDQDIPQDIKISTVVEFYSSKVG